MKKIKLGKTDLYVAPINFGGNVFGWTLNKNQSFDILNQFTDLGFNFIDTADNYSAWVEGNIGGESETIIGEWFKTRKNRENIILSTKVGGKNATQGINITKKHILSACDESLKRLQTDYIDIYYTHFDDEQVPVEETLSAYEELIKAGKVRYIGASNISPTRLINSLETAKKSNLPQYQVLQPHYNLIDRRKYEVNYASLAKKYELAVLPYFSLASGFLTGKYRTKADFNGSKRADFVRDYLNKKNLSIVNKLIEIADSHNVIPSAIALTWLLEQPNIAAPIASATKESHLKAFVKAVDLKLSNDELVQLDSISKY